MRNFNEIFRKDVTYDNIKSHKKPGFHLSVEDTFFEKPQRGGQIDLPSRFVVNAHDNIVISKFFKAKMTGYSDKFVRPLVLVMPKISGYIQTYNVKSGDKDKTIN